MAGEGYDGTIRIDTKIDPDGMSKGLKDVEKKAQGGLKGFAKNLFDPKAIQASLTRISGAFTGIKRIGAGAFSGLGKMGAMAMAGISAFAAGAAVQIVNLIRNVMFLATVLTAAGMAIAGMAFFAFKAFSGIVNSMARATSAGSEMGQQARAIQTAFSNIRNAIVVAFSPLITFALPYIKMITDWLIKALNVLAMVIAKLTGQATVMQFVASSSTAAAGGAGKLADETERANEAAEGALGAFDELNVLQQAPEATDAAGGGGGGAGGIQMTEVPVDEEILNKVKAKFQEIWQTIKEKFWLMVSDIWGKATQAAQDIMMIIGMILVKFALWFRTNVWVPMIDWLIMVWGRVTEAWTALWNGIGDIITTFANWFKFEVWQPMIQFFIDVWNMAKDAVVLIFMTIVAWFILQVTRFKNEIWEPIKNWAIETFNKVKEKAIEAWENLRIKWNEATAFFSGILETVRSYFEEKFNAAKTKAVEVYNTIIGKWGEFANYFQTKIIDPFKEGWDTVLKWLGNTFRTTFEGVRQTAKNIINGIIGFLNGLLNGVTQAINHIIRAINSIKITLPSWIPEVGGMSFGISLGEISGLQIPYLATGAVIPPNAAFAAILGDQRHGTNIEAPEELIRQIVREETGSQQEIKIGFSGTLGALVQQLKPYIDNENKRVGTSLVRGNR